MSWFPTGIDSGGQASLGIGDNGIQNSQLWDILLVDDIIPGSSPSYQACKTIYAYHPLGRKMVELPLEKAFSQERQISFNDPSIPIVDELVSRFRREWRKIGGIGGNTIIYRIGVLSRIYGVGSLLCGTVGQDPGEPLDWSTIHKQQLYFSMLDPLNTAGSLVLQQDPTAPDFLKPVAITAAGKNLDPSRTAVLIHEQPIWIEWTDSAFGFIGRSVFQRSLFPLKSYILSLIADNEIQRKLMLLIAKMKSPGSVADGRALNFFGLRRTKLKDSATGNVLSIGIEEDVEAIDLKNVDTAGTYARNNIIRNIAAASGMPAMLLLDERIADGFGEGSEDAKEISIYIDSIRQELSGIFGFMDKIVMRRAWNPDWYKHSIQSRYSEYAGIDYETAFYMWQDAFEASWPALYQPPESEQMEAEEKKVMVTMRVYETLAKDMDPANKTSLMEWVQDQLHNTRFFSKTDMAFDPETFEAYVQEQMQLMQQMQNAELQAVEQPDDDQPASHNPRDKGGKEGPKKTKGPAKGIDTHMIGSKEGLPEMSNLMRFN